MDDLLINQLEFSVLSIFFCELRYPWAIVIRENNRSCYHQACSVVEIKTVMICIFASFSGASHQPRSVAITAYRREKRTLGTINGMPSHPLPV